MKSSSVLEPTLSLSLFNGGKRWLSAARYDLRLSGIYWQQPLWVDGCRIKECMYPSGTNLYSPPLRPKDQILVAQVPPLEQD